MLIFRKQVFMAIILILLVSLFSNVGIAQDVEKIVQIQIAGNQNINSDAISSAITTKVGDIYDQTKIDADKTAIIGLGYFSAVTERKESIAGGVSLTYEVTENPRITEIKILNSDPVTADKVLAVMKSKSNLILNDNTLRQDYDAIQALFADLGYFAYVTEETGIDPKTGVLSVPILVHTVEEVVITGNVKTKPYVFQREMKTKKGSIFNAKILQADIMKIYSLDILEDIKPYKINPGSKPGLLKVEVPVVEKKTGQISLGLGYSSKERLVGQIRLQETNFRGRGQGANLLWEQGASSNAIGGGSSQELGFFEPWLDKKQTSLSLNVFNKLQYRFSSGGFGGSGSFADDATYNERHKGFDGTLARPLTEKFKIFFGTRFENVEADHSSLKVSDGLSSIIMTGDVTSFSLKGVLEGRDLPIDPAWGQYSSLAIQYGISNSIQFIPKLVGTVTEYDEIPFDGTFTKISGDYRRYFSKGGPKTKPKETRRTIAFRMRMGVSTGKMPFFEQFFLGGGETLRGYKEDRFWGKNMFLSSVEYRHPVSDSFTAVAFGDYGSAWDASPDFKIEGSDFIQNKSFEGHLGIGLGIRVVTPIGYLRLDYGTGDEGSRTHFSMGQAF